MGKLTVLDMVTDILSDMESDEVNSISDTQEALQVAQIIKTTYFEIIDAGDWPHLKQLFQLEGLADTNKPSHMKLPENVEKVEDLRYNKITSSGTDNEWTNVIYLDPVEFLKLTNARNSSDTVTQQVTDPSGVELLINNDFAPTYWTSFDDEHIVFDSFDVGVDTTMQSSKTQCYGYRTPTFSLVDSFIPDLPTKNFSYLLSEAKSVAFNSIKQEANAKEEQRSERQRRRLGQERWRTKGGITFPNYGRN